LVKQFRIYELFSKANIFELEDEDDDSSEEEESESDWLNLSSICRRSFFGIFVLPDCCSALGNKKEGQAI